LLNARSEEELKMIKTKNPRIVEAMKEMKAMSLRKDLQMLYEAHLKEVRDRYAREEYVRMEGIEKGRVEGRAEGRAEGRVEGRVEDILQLLAKKGPVPAELEADIRKQKDPERLGSWLLLAARSEGVEAFAVQAGLAIQG
ncbi:MAG: hypothetical protein NC427_16875, partial [Ruminococcus flavefaciens]|nr:hypothetical protein [Ruminococcus flavefaciens]